MNNSKAKPTWNFHFSVKYAFVFLIIGYGVWKTSLGLEDLMDVRFYDESYYLTQGLFHPVNSWLADYSALYSLFYKAFASLTTKNPIDLYYQNYRFWALILSITIFISLRTCGVNFWVCLMWSLCSLTSELNYVLWPKAGHLAMSGVLLGLLGLKKLNFRTFDSLIWITGICLIISWCRPEFFIGFVLGLVCTCLGLFFFKNKALPTKDLWIFIPFLLAIIFYSFWGLPMGSSGRGLVAIGQHYVHNWRNFSGNNKSDMMWDWVNWREQFAKDFGTTESVFQALMNNPMAFLSHIWFNLKYLPYKCFIYFFETLLPNRWFGISTSISIGIVWISLEFSQNLNGLSNWWKRRKHQIKIGFLPVLLISVPSLAAGLIFQPRPHYLIPLFPVFLFLIGSILVEYQLPQFSIRVKTAIGILYVLMICIFLPDASACFKINKKSKTYETTPSQFNHFEPVTTDGLKQKLLIKKLLAFKFKPGTNMFDASTGATEYLGQRLVQKGKIGFEMKYSEMVDFSAFLKKEKIDAIFLRPSIKYDHFFSRKKDWQQLLSLPNSVGWKKSAIGTNGDSLLLKTN